MQRLVRASLFLGALALIGVLAGCRGGQEAATPLPPEATEADVAGAALGTEQSAGPFQVTLATDTTAPTAGDTRFEAVVTRNGSPVTDAQVELDLSMPSMEMSGPDVTLDHVSGGRYEGTASLSMGGAWQASVTVTDAGEMGTAVYDFDASQ